MGVPRLLRRSPNTLGDNGTHTKERYVLESSTFKKTPHFDKAESTGTAPTYGGYESRGGGSYGGSYGYDGSYGGGRDYSYRRDDYGYRRDSYDRGGYGRDRGYGGGGGSGGGGGGGGAGAGGYGGGSRSRGRSPPPQPRRYEIIKGNENDRSSTTILYVGNLPYHFEERDVRDLFGRYGPLRSVNVPFDRFTRRNKGFSFVEYEERRDAEDALEKLQGWPIDNRKIKIDWDVGLGKKDEIKGKAFGGGSGSSSAPGNSSSNDRSYGRNDSSCGADLPPGTY
ncbi:hypothetical protein SeMB42_g04065 [Synchytrium endobioticum]|uniref:RRM domain-containing protein n=1 Tax=Synchytrium endobioticum TaxID=286115 RepID=A0A507D1D6_9FUNG|nr:hypothetical protein SeMB42_g04065 [Synchytrium endobioticum]